MTQHLQLHISSKYLDDAHSLRNEAISAIDKLKNRNGLGSDFLGWLKLPEYIDDTQLFNIETVAVRMRQLCDVVVVIGIGGSYLGAKAVIEAVKPYFKTSNDVEVVFAGQHLNEQYLYELKEYLKNKRFGIVCISKSGTTTEPGVAFRLLREQLLSQHQQDSKERIVIITDAKKGALRKLADMEGLTSFEVAEDVGGRYSVLSAVGLLPIAIAGVDIRELIKGAHYMMCEWQRNDDVMTLAATEYAMVRNLLYRQGKKIEILSSFSPKLACMAEWWKQLYGESEGKQHKGLFPASVNYTTDLHSLGQWIQDGERIVFETIVEILNVPCNLCVPYVENNLDNLNYLAGHRISEVNHKAAYGTMIAHIDGGVPVLRITLPELNAYYLGELIFFFELSCGISGYMLGVNPFDQPGVESYKNNMFALMNKPGYEQLGEELHKRIDELL